MLLLKLGRNLMARRLRDERIAKRIRACFDNVDLTKHSFIYADRQVQTTDGVDLFYKAPEVDKAIANINKLMRELRREKQS